MLMGLEGRGLLIHHWDTDGICSTALILEAIRKKQVINWTPPIGKFYLDDPEMAWASEFDHVFIVDMALPEENVLRIAETARVTVLDHHHQPVIGGIDHINPVAKGGSSQEYPSASWVVNTYLANSVNLYAILGVVGDREDKIRDNPQFWPIIQRFCGETGLTFEGLHRMAMLIDSPSRMGNKEGVVEAPHTLLSYDAPEEILSNQQWQRNLEILDEEITEIMAEPPEELDGVLVKCLESSHNIISTVTRRIAWGSGRDTVVLNTGFFPLEDQMYVRSETRDMMTLISQAKKRGFYAGGKREVLGAIVPKEETESFLDDVLDYLIH